MKSILKKVAGVALAALLALGMIGCSNGSSDDPIMPPVISSGKIPEGFVKVKGTTITGTEEWTPASYVFVSGRSITIPDMYVCDHEVTRGEFKEVMGSDPSTASAYDKEADGYRLPTEAEWEWLARGGENYTYAGSNTVDDVAWYITNTNDTGSREVKTKKANGYGLYDMSGNVYEWCYDWKDTVSSNTADTGASSGSYRVRRGGSWNFIASYCAVSNRGYNNPNYRSNGCGFRVVRSANQRWLAL